MGNRIKNAKSLLKNLLKLTTIFSVLTNISCSSTEHNAAQALQTGGIVQINELPKSTAEIEGYDLKAVIRSAYDFNLNTNNLEDRLKLISALLPDCKNPVLVNEKTVEGKTVLGVTMNRYYMDISCGN